MIIGLTGPKGSGKDTAFSFIKQVDSSVESLAFADPIKSFLCQLLHITLDQYDILKRLDKIQLNSNFELSISGRDLVRGIGMKMREYNPDQFVHYVEQTIKQDPSKVYICTDVRFDNEIKLIQKYHGKIIMIRRPGIEYDGHVSEQNLDVWDYYVVNKDKEQFKSDIIRIYNQIRNQLS